jgi:acetyl-CoA carboxylase carboxyltransferase component
MIHPSLNRLEQMEAQARQGGGAKRVEEQHERGKMTAHERIEQLLDPGSFFEMEAFALHRASQFGMQDKKYLGDGVVSGWGEIDGRLVYVFAQDFTVLGGSVGEAHGRKICKLLDLALENGAPVIGLNDSGGARIQEGVSALAAYGDIFYRNTLASGVIPQISVIMGPCAGGAVYSPALTDFTIMVQGTAQMFITGPDVIRAVTHEEITSEELGGAQVHHRTSGVTHFVAADDYQALSHVRELLSYLPSNSAEDPPHLPSSDPPDRVDAELDALVPPDPAMEYDMRRVITCVMDEGKFLEVQGGFAPNLMVGFARLAGQAIGVVAQQPAELAGVLDIDAVDKGARFIRFCDCFNIPLITFADTPGFMPGVAQEHRGIIRHGAKMIFAYAEATVPKISIITRKAYGGAYIVMSSKHLAGDICLAWPSAEIAVMGPEGAVNIVFRQELAEAGDAEKRRAELVTEYREQFASPYSAAGRGYIDGVIPPRQTRPALIRSLHMLRNKQSARPRRKHGNIPM